MIFSTLLCGAIVTSLLQTALTTALPAIMREFALAADRAQWLTSAFSLTMAIMIPATAFLIRRFTTRRIFVVSMAAFTVGTLIGWISTGFVALLIGRILQAMGSGILLPLLQVSVMTLYPKQKQGAVMGIYGLAAGAAPVIAPTLTGLMIDRWGWRSIFLVTLVLAAATLILSLVTIRNVGATGRPSFDAWSMLLCATGMAGLLIGLGRVTSGSLPEVTIPLGLGLTACVLFVVRQREAVPPFLDLRTMRDRRFRLAVIISFLLYAVMMGGSAIYPILIQGTMRFSAMVSGLAMLPGSLVMALVSPLAGRWYDRSGMRGLALVGSLTLFLSCLGSACVQGSGGLWLLVFMYALRLFGVGCIMTPVVAWGMQGLPEGLVADGTALLTSLRTVGGAFGSAVFMEIMTFAGGRAPLMARAGYIGARASFLSMAFLALIQLVAVIPILWKR